MPITAAIIALLARWLIGLTWTEAFLLVAALPDRPGALGRVVADPRVPRVVRHSLNLKSGLNDGLALPAVLAFAAALEVGNSGFVWWHSCCRTSVSGSPSASWWASPARC